MKIVFCGPPHSGKSVFIVSLEKLLLADGYETVRASRDGEGDWSNNSDQDNVKNVRVKGTYGRAFLKEKCRVIKNSKKPIVLVDIGGMLYPDKADIFRACDSFVVLSSDEVHRKEWQEFGKSLGCRCIASISSEKHGEDCLETADKGVVRGKICGLERGTLRSGSPVVEAVADRIIEISKYKAGKKQPASLVDINAVARRIGCGVNRKSGRQDIFCGVLFRSEDAGALLDEIDRIPSRRSYRVDGARANWVNGAVLFALMKKNPKRISLYDTTTHRFIMIRRIKEGEQAEKYLSYNVLESGGALFVDFNPLGKDLRYQDIKKMRIPPLPGKKTLLVSGRIPMWLLDSVLLSYGAMEIYVYQPGKNKADRFVCVSSRDKSAIGRTAAFYDIDCDSYFAMKAKK